VWRPYDPSTVQLVACIRLTDRIERDTCVYGPAGSLSIWDQLPGGQQATRSPAAPSEHRVRRYIGRYQVTSYEARTGREVATVQEVLGTTIPGGSSNCPTTLLPDARLRPGARAGPVGTPADAVPRGCRARSRAG
jgi:hypothetical protein